jgi:hypothetical protein
MWDILFYLFLIVLLAGAVVAGAIYVRAYLAGTSPTAMLFGPRPERRLDIMEQTSLDSRRRLVLIRRDDVEHLIMTGGPVDVVIETGIREKPSTAVSGVEAPSTPVFTRQPRAVGQTTNDH